MRRCGQCTTETERGVCPLCGASTWPIEDGLFETSVPAEADPAASEPVDERRLLLELHSLSRYPPIGLDDDACDALEEMGLVLAIQRRGPHQSGRYHLTTAGKARRDATADECGIPHCACKGGVDVEEVESRITDALRKHGLAR